MEFETAGVSASKFELDFYNRNDGRRFLNDAPSSAKFGYAYGGIGGSLDLEQDKASVGAGMVGFFYAKDFYKNNTSRNVAVYEFGASGFAGFFGGGFSLKIGHTW
ncbi:hypothetical protein FAZ19_23540 [Sphingobacterium alkalisoli]|uniref:Uncharacterized protein n=1 Tax=Sphingobacterium alkalisoli TaxID=1874115 RepID=A0A4U0GLQ1_9SPHI|nr:hypothetical protein [Sphingobacterium alkalisoli]TJY59715.1 hypothetical protein FAZ19_23540 [Sphingobacterium alkalisoli]GGH33005.1 hypothetical protein GCM10011418_46920 [Sphingobacterium alkalisoli]